MSAPSGNLENGRFFVESGAHIELMTTMFPPEDMVNVERLGQNSMDEVGDLVHGSCPGGQGQSGLSP